VFVQEGLFNTNLSSIIPTPVQLVRSTRCTNGLGKGCRPSLGVPELQEAEMGEAAINEVAEEREQSCPKLIGTSLKMRVVASMNPNRSKSATKQVARSIS
jgi:hypothetical protein